jgi:hypothetical protein
MTIDRVITMASPAVALEFAVMERSLRATGCDLPLEVIPFTDERFDLPPNAAWLIDEDLFAAVERSRVNRPCRKFAAFFRPNAVFFDADIVHLRDFRPELERQPDDVFVVADTEWNKARWTFSGDTRSVYETRTSLWLLDQFNSGFFGFTDSRVTQADVIDFLADPRWSRCAREESATAGEQPAANWLVHRGGLPVVNLCLPPRRLESTMAVDYPAEGWESLVEGSNGPFFLHYAGGVHWTDAPCTKRFTDWLTAAERGRFEEQKAIRTRDAAKRGQWPWWVRGLNRVIPALDRRFRIAWEGRR